MAWACWRGNAGSRVGTPYHSGDGAKAPEQVADNTKVARQLNSTTATKHYVVRASVQQQKMPTRARKLWRGLLKIGKTSMAGCLNRLDSFVKNTTIEFCHCIRCESARYHLSHFPRTAHFPAESPAISWTQTREGAMCASAA